MNTSVQLRSSCHLLNCPVNHLVTVKILHIQYNLIFYCIREGIIMHLKVIGQMYHYKSSKCCCRLNLIWITFFEIFGILISTYYDLGHSNSNFEYYLGWIVCKLGLSNSVFFFLIILLLLSTLFSFFHLHFF